MSEFLHHATKDEKRYFKFATIRNPLDYMVTHYLKLKNNHKGQYTNPEQLLVNGGHVTDLHIKQFEFTQQDGVTFPDYMSKFFDQPYNNWFLIGANKLDFVIRFENLQEDYTRVLQLIGLEQHNPVPHVNPTKNKKKRNYAEYYTEELVAKVAQNYGPFMQHWGYEFPAKWNAPKVPQVEIMKFNVKNNIGNTLAPHMLMNPDAPTIKRLKKLADRVL